MFHREGEQAAAQPKPRKQLALAAVERRPPEEGEAGQRVPRQLVPRAWVGALPLGLQGNPSRAGSGRKNDKVPYKYQNILINRLTLNSVNANVFFKVIITREEADPTIKNTPRSLNKNNNAPKDNSQR
jgi:hypothetical protein